MRLHIVLAVSVVSTFASDGAAILDALKNTNP
jgi:hypothetical protein